MNDSLFLNCVQIEKLSCEVNFDNDNYDIFEQILTCNNLYVSSDKKSIFEKQSDDESESKSKCEKQSDDESESKSKCENKSESETKCESNRETITGTKRKKFFSKSTLKTTGVNKKTSYCSEPTHKKKLLNNNISSDVNPVVSALRSKKKNLHKISSNYLSRQIKNITNCNDQTRRIESMKTRLHFSSNESKNELKNESDYQNYIGQMKSDRKNISIINNDFSKNLIQKSNSLTTNLQQQISTNTNIECTQTPHQVVDALRTDNIVSNSQSSDIIQQFNLLLFLIKKSELNEIVMVASNINIFLECFDVLEIFRLFTAFINKITNNNIYDRDKLKKTLVKFINSIEYEPKLFVPLLKILQLEYDDTIKNNIKQNQRQIIVDCNIQKYIIFKIMHVSKYLQISQKQCKYHQNTIIKGTWPRKYYIIALRYLASKK
jgi:hypothetical protein